MKFNREMLEKAMARKIFAWVDDAMKQLLPDDIYQCAHCGSPVDRIRANNWMQEKGYRVVSQPDGVIQIFRGAAVVKQTKLVLELTDPEELLQIAEVVKDNVNIPPPPWQPRSQ